jgi:hypothetical protein
MPARSMDDHRTLLAAMVLGAIGWIGVLTIASGLAAGDGTSLGFDLELLLQAGRAVAAGQSPYDPRLIDGQAPLATSLFYSYPPPVAQMASLVAWVPSRLIHLAWSVGAFGGVLLVTDVLRRRLAPERGRWTTLAVVAACLPLALPFVVGLLFGNLDVWFPLLYGAMTVAAIHPTGTTAIGGGAGLAAASLKLHPSSMALWFVVRAVLERAIPAGRAFGAVVVVAALGGTALIATSVLLGGTAPWSAYADVVRAGTGSAIVDPRNAGIAAQIALWTGGSDALSRSLHLAVGASAVLLTGWAAWQRSDPLESIAWAAAASLATLPVTWYHYPSAMIPIAIAAALRAPAARRRRTLIWIILAGVASTLGLVWLPLVWVAVGLVIAAAGASSVRSLERPPVPAAAGGMAPVREGG